MRSIDRLDNGNIPSLGWMVGALPMAVALIRGKTQGYVGESRMMEAEQAYDRLQSVTKSL